ncbi:MAG: hypothetical protein [Bacteriophage sp.]|jgi:hypothetical protein|nr:MAG: hypothetical protein [Bacteriophage sp.]UVX35812.1 MAG: hypothetical protein [Bacteriophage sp.]UVX38026.1 MAG: hypothetical protein [Bacteriophage sp.]UVX38096.1 MAG: hypothetical protein [Bacteriophage sp.]UVX48378.1 MAG: hypothetical protein [Bacteriophage sp.]
MNSKNKGNRFERKIGAWFTQWTGFKFERNRAGSGAWHSNKDATSDLTCTDERHAHRCKISIECKNYKDIKFEHVLLGNKTCDILRFWEQASKDAKRANKLPILCMRYNSMPANEFFFVVEGGPGTLGDFIWVQSKKPSMSISTSVNLYVFLASDILENVNYKQVHKQAKLIIKKK